MFRSAPASHITTSTTTTTTTTPTTDPLPADASTTSGRTDVPAQAQQNIKKAKHGPPLRPNSKAFVAGLKRPKKVGKVGNEKKMRTDEMPRKSPVFKENYNNFMNFLSKNMGITYRMKRGRG